MQHNRRDEKCAKINKRKSVSKTIRKPPLTKAQTALGKQNNTAKNDFQYGGWNNFTLQCNVAHGSGMTCH